MWQLSWDDSIPCAAPLGSMRSAGQWVKNTAMLHCKILCGCCICVTTVWQLRPVRVTNRGSELHHVINAVQIAAPFTMIQRQQVLRRRAATRNHIAQRLQEAGLIVAAAVEARAGSEAG